MPDIELSAAEKTTIRLALSDRILYLSELVKKATPENKYGTAFLSVEIGNAFDLLNSGKVS
jgi:hypothetical protein